eukprot:jgi/Bigna1/129305/aug1.8_g4013
MMASLPSETCNDMGTEEGLSKSTFLDNKDIREVNRRKNCATRGTSYPMYDKDFRVAPPQLQNHHCASSSEISVAVTNNSNIVPGTQDEPDDCKSNKRDTLDNVIIVPETQNSEYCGTPSSCNSRGKIMAATEGEFRENSGEEEKENADDEIASNITVHPKVNSSAKWEFGDTEKSMSHNSEHISDNHDGIFHSRRTQDISHHQDVSICKDESLPLSPAYSHTKASSGFCSNVTSPKEFQGLARLGQSFSAITSPSESYGSNAIAEASVLETQRSEEDRPLAFSESYQKGNTPLRSPTLINSQDFKQSKEHLAWGRIRRNIK